MQVDLGELPDACALVFPGQGAQSVGMLEPFRGAPRFDERLRKVCEWLGFDPLAAATSDPTVLNRNAVSSLLTVLASLSALEVLRSARPTSPVACAGYSVGQWTALHAAGRLAEDDLFRVVAGRARLMDACLSPSSPSGMLAVIGVREADLEAVCAELRDDEATRVGAPLTIANYNAPGQFTLAGSEVALARAEVALAALHPKRVVRLGVAGAWHGPEMAPAVHGLAASLAELPLAPGAVPVIDNVTGAFLPDDPDACRAALARQVAAPVRWMDGVRTLIAHGATCLLEVGFGDVLTRFGFFVDRSVSHRAMAPSRGG